MHRIYFVIVVLSILSILITACLGIFNAGILFKFHLFSGFFLALWLCLVHCMVMFHFLGSGKAVREAAAEIADGKEFVLETKKFKRQVFPLFLLSMLFSMSAAISGGACLFGAGPVILHDVFVGFTVFFNFFTFFTTYETLKRNSELIDRLDTVLENSYQRGDRR